MSGLKRVDSDTRAATPIVDWDESKGLVKVNPIATWSHDDVSHYEADRKLPIHPLFRKGYLSIGCSPTTRPVSNLEDRRSGRWSGTDKTECGLHFVTWKATTWFDDAASRSPSPTEGVGK